MPSDAPCLHLTVIWWRTPPYDHERFRRQGGQRFTEGFDCADCGEKNLLDSPLTIYERGGKIRRVERHHADTPQKGAPDAE